MTQVQAIIKQRGDAYGDYATQAEIARTFKREIEKRTDKMTPTQREALDMIAVKISRLVNGDPSHRDSWVDIVGYAILAISELDRANADKEDTSEEIEESLSVEDEETALHADGIEI